MPRAVWTQEMENCICKNIHLTNQVLSEKLGVTLASVENKVRELGLARIFQPDEVEILRKLWGKRRTVIQKALPRFNWRQISKKANNIGLPPLNDAAEAVNLYSILSAIGESDATGVKWKDAGLRVRNDKTKQMKNNILMVDIDDFWIFAMQHHDIVDLTRLGDNVFEILGTPPPELAELRKIAKPLVRRVKHKSTNKQKREDIAYTYFRTSMSVDKIAETYGVATDTVRHAACENKKLGQKRSRYTDVITETFCKKLERLYYQDCKTYVECAEALNCSKSSVGRGIKKIMNKKI